MDISTFDIMRNIEMQKSHDISQNTAIYRIFNDILIFDISMIKIISRQVYIFELNFEQSYLTKNTKKAHFEVFHS